MAKFSTDVSNMSDEYAKELLEEIIDKLDELDEDDYFGSEGWKHCFGFED